MLVTGSLHLVGGVLSLLDPELQCLDSGKDTDHTMFRCCNVQVDSAAASVMTPVVP